MPGAYGMTTSARRSAWWTTEISFTIEHLPGRCRGILPRRNEAPRACVRPPTGRTGLADPVPMKPRAPASGRLTQARLARERAAASHSHGTNRAPGPRWNQKRHAERLRAVPWLRPPTDRTGPADRTGVNDDAERLRAVPWLRPPTDRTGPAAPATLTPATRADTLSV